MDESMRRRVEEAVAEFWQTRTMQGRNQGVKAGQRDAGKRTEVTGGKQLDGFLRLVQILIAEAGAKADAIHVAKRRTILPGYFRATKQWDIVAVVDGLLLASIEFKSQVGSFGNNFNNRSEESVGSAVDLWTAYREGAFGSSPRPWLGYLMLLEDHEETRRAVASPEPHFSVFPEFAGASYARRYELLCRKLMRERLYDATCLLLSPRDAGLQGTFSEPAEDLAFGRFAASLISHVQNQLRYGSS